MSRSTNVRSGVVRRGAFDLPAEAGIQSCRSLSVQRPVCRLRVAAESRDLRVLIGISLLTADGFSPLGKQMKLNSTCWKSSKDVGRHDDCPTPPNWRLVGDHDADVVSTFPSLSNTRASPGLNS